MEKVEVVTADGARLEAYRHGAHVTSWRPAGGDERLFLSTRSAFAPGIAIRGGVPVIFPQFAGEGPLPKHGFARVVEWELISVAPAGMNREGREALFRLMDSAQTRQIWPHAFDAKLSAVVASASLALELTITNTDAQTITFTAALHTYLRVDDVRDAFVRGLEGASFRDRTASGGRRAQTERDLVVDAGIDRVYLGSTNPIEVRDSKRTTRVSMRGFRDVVVWNPGPAGGAALPDLEPDGYLRMLCVEAAAVGNPVRLQPGERWIGAQILTAV